MTGNFAQVPVVDVSALIADVPGAAERQAAEALTAAARTAGFLYVTGHGIAESVLAGLRRQAERYFAQPLDAKMRQYIGLSRCHRGYVPKGEEVFYGGTADAKEAFDLALDLPPDDPAVRAGTPLLGANQWPELEGFRGPVLRYYTAALGLGLRLFRGLAIGLGLPPEHFARHVSKPPSQLRLVHYPVSPPGSDTPGIGAHTDYEMLTILVTTAPGLEVQNGRGEWIDAPPMPGAMVVNIGDMLEAWTNGTLVATAHRVRPVAEERYSFPLFCSVDYPTVVAPDAAFVTLDRPAAYPPIVAGDHLLAQTVQTFRYLRDRLERGQLALPPGALALSSFGPKARRVPGAMAGGRA